MIHITGVSKIADEIIIFIYIKGKVIVLVQFYDL